jgi:hypothetical protein
MSPAEFERAGLRLFGKKWKSPLSRALKLDPSTIWRYVTGHQDIPRVVELAVKELLQRKQ